MANIDLEKGPDYIQINLAMKLNIFKIFSLQVMKKKYFSNICLKSNEILLFNFKENNNERLISEMIQCLNIVLLLNDSQRSFEILFDKTLQNIQSYSTTVKQDQIISLICQLINGLDMVHQKSKSLKNSKILLKCLENQPNNYRLIYFASNYLSPEYRIEYLNLICQTFTDDINILKIIIKEIKINNQINDERFLDTIIDGLKIFNENIEEPIECIIELINRMKKISNDNWKNILRLKQKMIFKLIKQDQLNLENRILVAKLILQYVEHSNFFFD